MDFARFLFSSFNEPFIGSEFCRNQNFLSFNENLWHFYKHILTENKVRCNDKTKAQWIFMYIWNAVH